MPTHPDEELFRRYYTEEMPEEERRRIEAAVAEDEEAAAAFERVGRETLHQMVDSIITCPDLESVGDVQEHDPEIAKLVRSEMSKLAQAEYWSLVPADNRTTVFPEQGSAEAVVRRRTGQADARTLDTPEDEIPVRIERVEKDPPTFRLVGNLPDGYELLGVKALRLNPFQRKPLELPVDVQSLPTSLQPPDKPTLPVRPDKMTGAAEHALEVSAAGAAEATPKQQQADVGNDDFKCQPRWKYGAVDLRAKMPLDRGEDFVVVELTYTNLDGNDAARRGVFKMKPDDTDRRWSNWRDGHFDLPPLSDADRDKEITLRFRSLDSGDLYLLKPAEIEDLLAIRDTVTMLPKRVADGHQFRARWESQRQALADPAICWMLQVAPTSEDR